MKLNSVGSNSVLSVVEVEESYPCNLDHGPLLSDLVGNGITTVSEQMAKLLRSASMAVRSCKVTCRDTQGIEHSVVCLVKT